MKSKPNAPQSKINVAHGTSKAIEYLAATKAHEYTRGPGKESFTSALIFALKALRKERERFTTIELLRKINQYKDLPKDQKPVLSDRQESTSTANPGRIMLHPLPRSGQPKLAKLEVFPPQDPNDRHILTLHFDFASRPSEEIVRTLGRQLNQVTEYNTLGVNRIKWGGMQSFARTAASGFIKSLQRRRSTQSPTEPRSRPAWATQENTPSLTREHSSGDLGLEQQLPLTDVSNTEALIEVNESLPQIRVDRDVPVMFARSSP